jgi:hypothetical protein
MLFQINEHCNQNHKREMLPKDNLLHGQVDVLTIIKGFYLGI